MNKVLHGFEKIIITALLVMMIIVVFLGTIELGIILVTQMMNSEPWPLMLGIDEMLTGFGFFMMILIGLELVETIKVYLISDEIFVEVIFLVAIIAISRKVIILDFKKTDPMTLLGMAAIIIALSAGFFLVKKAMHTGPPINTHRDGQR